METRESDPQPSLGPMTTSDAIVEDAEIVLMQERQHRFSRLAAQRRESQGCPAAGAPWFIPTLQSATKENTQGRNANSRPTLFFFSGGKAMSSSTRSSNSLMSLSILRATIFIDE